MWTYCQRNPAFFSRPWLRTPVTHKGYVSKERSGGIGSHGGSQGKEMVGPKVRLLEMGVMTAAEEMVPSSGRLKSAWVTARPSVPPNLLTLLCPEERGRGCRGGQVGLSFWTSHPGVKDPPHRQGIPWECGFLMRRRGSEGPGLQPTPTARLQPPSKHSPLPPELGALTKQSSSAQMTRPDIAGLRAGGFFSPRPSHCPSLALTLRLCS